MYDIMNENMIESISFSGGGYNCVYHLGVMKYIFENNDMFHETIYLGASAGAGIATLILAFFDHPDRMNIFEEIVIKIKNIKKNIKYNFTDQTEIYTNILIDIIKKDEDHACKNILRSNKLHISVTNISNIIPTNKIMTNFVNMKSVEDAIRASACIPFIFDNKFRNCDKMICIDGGFTNNLPSLNGSTIKINCNNFIVPKIHMDADIKPNRYVSLFNCFLHPGDLKINSLIRIGYSDFEEYISRKYIDKKFEDDIDKIEMNFLLC